LIGTTFARLCFVVVLTGAQASCAFAVDADSAGSSDTIELDLRDASWLPDLKEPDARKLLDQIGADDTTSLNGIMHGAFTAQGRAETLYLVQRGGPQAADPMGPGGVELAILRDGRLARRLPTDAGNKIAAAIETGGIDELVLATESYQMGVATTRITLVSLAGERVDVLASIAEARVDRCGDARFGGDVEASVIRIRHVAGHAQPEIATQRYKAACEDGQAPRVEKFRALAPAK